MMRWLLLLGTIAAIYWLYENGYYRVKPDEPRPAESRAPSQPLPPGPRPGGGLNPFYEDDGGGSPPQRPQVPAIPGR